MIKQSYFCIQQVLKTKKIEHNSQYGNQPGCPTVLHNFNTHTNTLKSTRVTTQLQPFHSKPDVF